MCAIYLAMAFNVCANLACIFVLILNCRPTRAYWKSYDPDWKESYVCYDTVAMNIIAPLLSVVTDLYSIVLPCLMLQGLNVLRRQKIGLNTVFALSLTVVAAACGRTVAYHRFSFDYDVTWFASP